MTALLTPLDKGNARQSGATLWRKQLLPVGEIDYKGRKIAFTREYLGGLVKAFTNRAYDQVPFQLADSANTHTNDPERFRGEVKGLELTQDGLDIIIAATEDGSALLAKNPALGVSARIVEDYARADGRHFPAAIQHVLGTLDPRIPGMRPWQAVEAANEDDGEVIDLTAIDYTSEDPEPAPAAPDSAPKAQEEEAAVAFTTEEEGRLKALLSLPQDKFDALITPQPEEVTEVTEDTEDDGEDTLTDEQLEQLLAEVGTEDATEDAEPELTGASLTAEAQAAIDLANSRADENAAELRRMRGQLDRATFEKERDYYQRTLGIPARITDLARPLLEGSGRTVELANGKHEDAGAIVRKLLGEVGKTFQQLGMDVELGNSEGADVEAERSQTEASDRTSFVKDYSATYGL